MWHKNVIYQEQFHIKKTKQIDSQFNVKNNMLVII